MKKSKKRDKVKAVVKNRGFFRSPLVLGLVNMIPLLALALTVAVVISEFKKQVYDLVVLGDRTEVPGVWVGAKRRIADLKRWGQISGSEKAVNEAIRLEKAL